MRVNHSEYGKESGPLYGLTLAFALTAVLLATLFACSSSKPTTSTAAPSGPLRGQIEGLDAKGGRLQAITVRGEAGTSYTYKIDNPATLNVDVPHLELHQRDKLPVTLYFVQRKGETFVEAIGD